MTILHVITTLRTGGAERLLVDLLPRIKRQGHRVAVLSLLKEDTPFARKLAGSDIEVLHLPTQGIYNPEHILSLPKVMEKFDIVHTHNSSVQFFVACARHLCGKQPLLITTEHNTWNRRRKIPFMRLADRLMYRNYSMIICVSKSTQDSLSGFIGDEYPVTTVPNGINLDRFRYDRRREFPETGEVRMIMVAGFRPQKDQATIVRAMKHLPERFTLRLVGDGETIDAVKALAVSEGVSDRVEFCGMRMDVPELLNDSHICVFSSKYEGLSLALCEALASGLPVIGSDVDGIRTTLRGTGILFPVGDDNALAREILELASSKEKYDAAVARSVAAGKEYDIDSMAEKYINIYRRELRNRFWR